jgi:murein DD-endopeptidase MepM/ murein hydrolase activator NlpD
MARRHAQRKGIADFMLLLLVVGLIAFIIIFWQYFYFLFRVITIKGNVNVFMSNDDAGTELVSLLAAKNSSVSHMERLGSYLSEYDYNYVQPLKDTLKAYNNYDFAFTGIGSFDVRSDNTPPIILDNGKNALQCGISVNNPALAGAFKWPLPSSSTIISGFGNRERPKGTCQCHAGIDISGEGDVYAAAPGTVKRIVSTCKADDKGCNGGAGNMIVIEHEIGTAKTKYYSFYMHLKDVRVKQGDPVGIEKPIAISGNTGDSDGPHLHFELRTDSSPSTSRGQYSIDPCSGFFANMPASASKTCEHEPVSVCKYVTGMISGKSVRSYQTDVPLPGPFSGAKLENLRGTVTFKQWD